MNKISFTPQAWEEYCYWKKVYRIKDEPIEIIQCRGHY